MFERRYRRTRSNADRRSWIDQTRCKQRLYASKQNQYWDDNISSSRGNPYVCMYVCNNIYVRAAA